MSQTNNLKRLHDELCLDLDHIKTRFEVPIRITLVIRVDDSPMGNLVVSNDDPARVIETILARYEHSEVVFEREVTA